MEQLELGLGADIARRHPQKSAEPPDAVRAKVVRMMADAMVTLFKASKQREQEHDDD